MLHICIVKIVETKNIVQTVSNNVGNYKLAECEKSGHSCISKRRDWTKIIHLCATRFGTAVISLKSLYGHNLQAMVMSNKFKNMLKVGNSFGYKQMLLNGMFWRNFLIKMKVMTHLLRLLSLCNSDEKSALGYIYGRMHRARKGVMELFKKNKELYKPYIEIIDHHWNKMLCKSIHCATYWLI
uniref:Uncharacterized protein n=1 Tax=Lactuca sativa TaxID=4236 RepID=A0A9R1VNK0_LACSA|nr:hypothetical protein LSAT_V11C500268320 [Lactuca sativa]